MFVESVGSQGQYQGSRQKKYSRYHNEECGVYGTDTPTVGSCLSAQTMLKGAVSPFEKH